LTRNKTLFGRNKHPRPVPNPPVPCLYAYNETWVNLAQRVYGPLMERPDPCMLDTRFRRVVGCNSEGFLSSRQQGHYGKQGLVFFVLESRFDGCGKRRSIHVRNKRVSLCSRGKIQPQQAHLLLYLFHMIGLDWIGLDWIGLDQRGTRGL
jgi:hypothetical protein